MRLLAWQALDIYQQVVENVRLKATVVKLEEENRLLLQKVEVESRQFKEGAGCLPGDTVCRSQEDLVLLAW